MKLKGTSWDHDSYDGNDLNDAQPIINCQYDLFSYHLRGIFQTVLASALPLCNNVLIK